jgi:arsenite methyltransferase
VIRTFTDHFRNVDEVIAFNRASSFGNELAGLGPVERARLRDAYAKELERSRDAEGIRQERHLIFAVAQKPLAS